MGSRFEGRSTFLMWRQVRLVCRITEWQPPRHYRYEVISGPIRADALWGIRPRDDGSYVFGAGDIVGRSASIRLLRPLAKPLYLRETTKEFDRLKRILESDRP